MILMNVFLPRFLILEGLLLFHLLAFPRGSMACKRQVNQVRQYFDSSDEANKTDIDGENVSQDLPAGPVCKIDLNQHTGKRVNLPLFYSASKNAFLLSHPGESEPRTERWLSIDQGDVIVTCPGAKVKPNGQKSSSVKCLQESKFDLDGKTLTFDDLRCSRSIQETVKKTEQACGPSSGNGKLTAIGWTVTEDLFVPQITLCHDYANAHTYYENHTIHGTAIEGKNVEAKRPSYFKEGKGLYDDTAADNAYKIKNQKATLKSLLGSEKGSEIFNSRTSYMAKGHLAPDADFIFKEWQDATYYFINVAPQWQAFNNGNWKAVEQSVRSYAHTAKTDIQVFTGTLGVLTLPADNGKAVKLYIAKEIGQDEFNHIPVPEFFWKIVYNPSVDEAIVFVGLNNPHLQGDPKVEAQICPDVCASAKWFLFYKDKVDKGFSYCCSYQDFKGVIDWIPDLGDPKLLENIVIPY